MGSSQKWTIFRGLFYAFQGHFLIQNGGYCYGLLKFQIFFGGALNSWVDLSLHMKKT